MKIAGRNPFLDLIRETPRIYPTLIARENTIFWLVALLFFPVAWFNLLLLIVIVTLCMIGNEFVQNAVAPA